MIYVPKHIIDFITDYIGISSIYNKFPLDIYGPLRYMDPIGFKVL